MSDLAFPLRWAFIRNQIPLSRVGVPSLSEVRGGRDRRIRCPEWRPSILARRAVGNMAPASPNRRNGVTGARNRRSPSGVLETSDSDFDATVSPTANVYIIDGELNYRLRRGVMPKERVECIGVDALVQREFAFAKVGVRVGCNGIPYGVT